MKYICCWFFVVIFIACQDINDLGVLVPPTVDQDGNLPRVTVNVAGHQRLIHVRTFGNSANPVLFVLHGSYSDTRAYRNICESLSDRYYVVIWDQRGCGLSERISEEEFTLESAVEEIDRMKEIYSPQLPVTILGHSWGGGLTTLYTSARPTNVAQLLLIEPMPLTGDDMQQLFKTIVDFSYFDETWNNLARHGEAISPQGHAQIDYRAMMILRSTMTSGYHCDGNNPPEWPIHRVGGFVEYVRSKRLGNPISGFTYDFRNGILGYTSEVLILGGSCSSLGYQMQVTYSQPHFANARVIEIKNAGHRMNMEQFPTVITEIKNFLNEY
ncbi:MAG: alpha/beta hydrolase [Cyclobacteriaceae bacterium]|jgi:proline iminopeptidase|nr:alpha/beta hydrolase [Cyclobacteriaceae bacterium]